MVGIDWDGGSVHAEAAEKPRWSALVVMGSASTPG